MTYTGAQRGLIVLRKPAVDDHKLSAQRLGITLFHDATFDLYFSKQGVAAACGSLKGLKRECWDYFEGNIPNSKKLAPLIAYRRNRYWSDPPSSSF